MTPCVSPDSQLSDKKLQSKLDESEDHFLSKITDKEIPNTAAMNSDYDVSPSTPKTITARLKKFPAGTNSMKPRQWEAQILFAGYLLVEDLPTCSYIWKDSDGSTKSCCLPSKFRFNRQPYCQWHLPTQTACASLDEIERQCGDKTRAKHMWVEIVRRRQCPSQSLNHNGPDMTSSSREVAPGSPIGDTKQVAAQSKGILVSDDVQNSLSQHAWDSMFLRAYDGRAAAAREKRYAKIRSKIVRDCNDYTLSMHKFNFLIGFACRWNSIVATEDGLVPCTRNWFDIATAAVDKGLDLKHLRFVYSNDCFAIVGLNDAEEHCGLSPKSNTTDSTSSTAEMRTSQSMRAVSPHRCVLCYVTSPRDKRRCVDEERIAWINVINSRSSTSSVMGAYLQKK